MRGATLWLGPGYRHSAAKTGANALRLHPGYDSFKQAVQWREQHCLEKLREALLGGAAASWIMQNLAPKMIAKDDTAGFRIDLMLKDLHLTGELAFALGTPLPGNALVTGLFLEARADGEGQNGNQALFRVYDRLCNQARPS